jgi:hypothetical protein
MRPIEITSDHTTYKSTMLAFVSGAATAAFGLLCIGCLVRGWHEATAFAWVSMICALAAFAVADVSSAIAETAETANRSPTWPPRQYALRNDS